MVAKIDPSEFKHMVSDLALWLRHNDAEDQVMAKFEVSLVLAKRKNNGEVYTENLNFICFCKDTYDREKKLTK